MWTYNYSIQNELYHYGIPGMKWGHRKARPIDVARNNYRMAKSQAMSNYRTSKAQAKAQAKADVEKAKQEYKNSPEYQAKKAKIKKAVKVGVAVAGTALAAYGAYKVAKLYSKKTSDLAEKMKMGRDEVSNLFKEYSSTKNFGDNVLSDRTTVNYVGFDGKAKKAVGNFARNTGKGVLAETNVEANVLTDKIVNPRNQSLANRVKTGVNDVIVRGAQKKYLKKYGSYNYK